MGVLLETPHMEPFLMHESTLAACSEQWQPDVACWSNYDTWFAEGCPSILDRAAEKCRERLESAPDDSSDPKAQSGTFRICGGNCFKMNR